MTFEIYLNETQMQVINALPMNDATNSDFVMQFCAAIDDSIGKAFTWVFVGFAIMMLGKRIGRFTRSLCEKQDVYNDPTCPKFVKGIIRDLPDLFHNIGGILMVAANAYIAYVFFML